MSLYCVKISQCGVDASLSCGHLEIPVNPHSIQTRLTAYSVAESIAVVFGFRSSIVTTLDNAPHHDADSHS